MGLEPLQAGGAENVEIRSGGEQLTTLDLEEEDVIELKEAETETQSEQLNEETGSMSIPSHELDDWDWDEIDSVSYSLSGEGTYSDEELFASIHLSDRDSGNITRSDEKREETWYISLSGSFELTSQEKVDRLSLGPTSFYYRDGSTSVSVTGYSDSEVVSTIEVEKISQ